MPGCVTYVKNADAAEVIKILVKHAAENAIHTRVIKQTGKILALVNERHNSRTTLAIVGSSTMPAPTFSPDSFKFFDDRLAFVLQQSGKRQVAERIHKGLLLGS